MRVSSTICDFIIVNFDLFKVGAEFTSKIFPRKFPQTHGYASWVSIKKLFECLCHLQEFSSWKWEFNVMLYRDERIKKLKI